jgi:hypothetical protein
MATQLNSIETLASQEYKWGFVTNIDADSVPPGLNEDTIRLISARKNEPQFMLDWRLKAYRQWLTMKEPTWANIHYPAIDYQKIIYYSAPKTNKEGPKSLDEVDPELLATYEKLGIPLRERELLSGVAVDAVFDSVSVGTTFKKKLGELGIVFCSFSEAVQEHPELVRKYLGTVVPHSDNFFAALNAAVFSDGSFCYIPKGVRCPMELSTYFRINAKDTGQFERTLIVADEGAYVSYLEGCTAPRRDTNQLHAAVVELVALDNATIKYSELVSRRQGRQRRHLQFRHQARQVSRREFENFLDASRNRLGHHLEISKLPVAGRQFRRRVLLRCPDKQLSAGRHGNENDSRRKEHEQHYRFKGHLGGPRPEHLSRRGENPQGSHGCPQLFAMRFHAARRQVRCAYVPLPRSKEHVIECRARSVHFQNRRGSDFLLPTAWNFNRGRRWHDRERLLQRSVS